MCGKVINEKSFDLGNREDTNKNNYLLLVLSMYLMSMSQAESDEGDGCSSWDITASRAPPKYISYLFDYMR